MELALTGVMHPGLRLMVGSWLNGLATPWSYSESWVEPLTLVIVTPDYSIMLVKEGEWFYLASNGRRGRVFEARFIKARGSAIRLTAPDALTVLTLLFKR